MSGFIFLPASDTESDGSGRLRPTSLTNAVLDADGAVTGLTNGVSYVPFYLVDGPARTPGTTTLPVFLDARASSDNTGSGINSFTATRPAYSTGDLVVVAVFNDGDDARVGALTVTAPDAETVTKRIDTFDDGDAGTNGHSATLFTYVAGATKAAAGADIVCTLGVGLIEQFYVVVMVFDAGTFNASTPLLNLTTSTSGTTGTTDVSSGGFTAAAANGIVVFIAGREFEAVSALAPSGWTQRINSDGGAMAIYAATRNAPTTTSETVAAQSFPGATGTVQFVGMTFLVNPA